MTEIGCMLIDEYTLSQTARNIDMSSHSREFAHLFTPHPHISNEHFAYFHSQNIAFKIAFPTAHPFSIQFQS